MTKILKCTCICPIQDLLHGIGMRVHNWARKTQEWRCTGCGKGH